MFDRLPATWRFISASRCCPRAWAVEMTCRVCWCWGLSDLVINRDEQLLTVITVLLMTLAVLNALFTTWAMVLDARRSSALMRALGARTRQVSTGFVVAQVLTALPGAILGIPLGLGIFKAAVHHGTLPPATWLAAAVLGALAAIAALTLVPARIGTRQPLAQVQSETA